MKHLDEGRLLAARDGAQLDPAAREHLEGCATCAAALEASRGRAESIERALAALDKPVEATAAKAGVRARLATNAPTRRSRPWRGRHLGRAAALLLLSAGAAAALPGSPLRTLLLPLVDDVAPSVQVGGPEATVSAGEPAPAEFTDAGIAVAVPDGSVAVIIRGADPGTEIALQWTGRATARVAGPRGSRFTYSAGRIEVDAARGSIHVALPVDARDVVLEVDGVTYLRGSQQALEVTGPAVERSSDTIRFRVDPL